MQRHVRAWGLTDNMQQDYYQDTKKSNGIPLSLHEQIRNQITVTFLTIWDEQDYNVTKTSM